MRATVPVSGFLRNRDDVRLGVAVLVEVEAPVLLQEGQGCVPIVAFHGDAVFYIEKIPGAPRLLDLIRI
jgi:hypothetical protein